MTSNRKIGRVVGGLVLLQLVGGLMLPYILLNRAVTPTGFLESAAANSGYLRGAVFLFLFGAAMTLAISIASYQVVRQYAATAALCLLALGIANFPLQTVESGIVLSMLSLSERYSQAAGTDGAMLQTVGMAVYLMRRGAHYTQLITVVCWIFLLFTILGRARLIPRVLAIVGQIACALQIIGVPVRAMLGYSVVMEMAIPLAPAYAGLAVWLMVKGFDERQAAAEGAAAA